MYLTCARFPRLLLFLPSQPGPRARIKESLHKIAQESLPCKMGIKANTLSDYCNYRTYMYVNHYAWPLLKN
jgi:hypothetical protein